MKSIYKITVISLMIMLTGCTIGKNQEKAMNSSDNNLNGIAADNTGGDDIASVTDAISLTLDPSIKYQVMESFGTSGCWWSQYVGGWDNEYRDTGITVRDYIATLLFDHEKGIGLTCYRYNIGAGSASSGIGTYWDPHRRTYSFETAPGVYDWDKDANAVWFMEKAAQLGVKEVVMFCNSPPERLTINGTAQVSKGKKENILPENYDAFAEYVMDVAEHFVDEGVPVRFISPINEPQWDWNEGQEGCHYEPAKIAKVYRTFLTELQSRPALSGVALSGPESGEWNGQTFDYVSALLNDSVLGSYFDTIDNHSYWSDTASKVAFKRWMDAKYPGIKLRMSEWCEMVNGSDTTMDSAFHLAEVLSEDLTVLDVVSWQNWVAVAPGGYRDGLIYINEQKKTFNPLKRLWGYGNYSRFIRPGYQRIDVSGKGGDMKDLKPVAFIGKKDTGEEEMVLVLINESEDARKVLLDIPNAVEYTNLSVYETSENNDLSQIMEGKYIPGEVIEIGKQSITTITLLKAGD